jgi:hypothetical protein
MKNNLISEVDRIKNLMLINEASGGVWDSVIAGLKNITKNESVLERQLDDILTKVKTNKINPKELVDKLSVLGMSLDGNTLVKYVEIMITGLDTATKTQIKQISTGLKDGTIQLVTAKNALSQIGQTGSVDDLLEKYADELSIPSVKKITKTADDYWKEIELTGWYKQNVPERIQGELRMRVSNILNSNPNTYDQFESAVKKAFSNIDIPPSNWKKFLKFWETIKSTKGLSLKQSWNMSKTGFAVTLLATSIAILYGFVTKIAIPLYQWINSIGGDDAPDVIDAAKKAQETTPEETKPKETTPQDKTSTGTPVKI